MEMPTSSQGSTSLTMSLYYKRREYMQDNTEMTFLKDTLLGGSDYLKGQYLFKHGREVQKDYDRRLQRAYFQNFCAPVVSIFAGFLTGGEIKIEQKFGDQSRFEKFLEDATGNKVSLAAFFVELVSWTAAQGKSYVIVDRPTVELEVQTRAAEDEAGVRTFVQRIPWEEVWDWETDEDGSFEWVKIHSKRREERTFQGKEKLVDRFTIWTKESWEIYDVIARDKEPVLVGRGVNTLGFVPVFELCWPNGSLIKDAAKINRSIYNWCSLLDETLYRQTFATLCLPGDLVDEVKLGTATALTFDPHGPAPTYIAPPSAPADLLMNQIDKATTAIRTILLMKADSDGASAQTSGVAKAYDFAQFNQTLLFASRVFEGAHDFILKTYAAWEQEPTDGVQVSYPRSFDVNNLQTMIDDAVKMQALNMGKMFGRYLKKRMARGYVDARDREEWTAIEEEIDSGSTEIQPLPPLVQPDGTSTQTSVGNPTPVVEPDDDEVVEPDDDEEEEGE